MQIAVESPIRRKKYGRKNKEAASAAPHRRASHSQEVECPFSKLLKERRFPKFQLSAVEMKVMLTLLHG